MLKIIIPSNLLKEFIDACEYYETQEQVNFLIEELTEWRDKSYGIDGPVYKFITEAINLVKLQLDKDND